jgi:hypothetical protein
VSAYVLGKELMDSLKIYAFEFVREYVLKGLTPYDYQGKPYQPAKVVYDFIENLQQQLVRRDESAWNLSGPEREEYIAVHIRPLQDRLHSYQSYLDCVQDYSWAEFGLPHDYELASSFIETLVNSRYSKKEVTRFLPWPVRSYETAKKVMIQSETSGLTHSQRSKLECRKIARRLWEQDPLLGITEMINHPEIIKNSLKLNGLPFSQRTVRNWICCLCPNQKTKRSLKKKQQV